MARKLNKKFEIRGINHLALTCKDMKRTVDQIRAEELDALRERLGRAGMIRFLQQFEHGSGDYAKERRDLVDNLTLEQLRTEWRKRRKPRTRKG